MHGCIDSWHFMALEQKKLWQKTHLRKLSHSTLWCENGFLTLQSVALNWKRDFGCETIRGYADIHVLCQYSLSFCLHQCLRANPLEALIWDELEGF